MKLIFISISLFFLVNPPVLYKNYEGHMQHCTGNFAVDRSWKLQLYANNTFVYTIKNADTKLFIDSRIKSFYAGNWKMLSDTLILTDTMRRVCIDKVFKYKMQDSGLVSLNNYVDNSWGFNNVNRVTMRIKNISTIGMSGK